MMDSELCIRSYLEDDRQEVVALWEIAFGKGPPRNEPNGVIDRKQAIADELFFVGTVKNCVVGTVLAGFDGVRGWIYHLAILPEFRRRGSAGLLMDHAEERLRARGCLKVNLQVRTSNAEVVAFYESRRFVADEVISFGKILNGGDE